MLDKYDLHPAINKGQCFQPTPPGNISREEPPPDSRWVDDLYRSCCEATNTTPKEPNPFQKHLSPPPVGEDLSAQVKEALFTLFRRFSGALDGQLDLLTPNETKILAGMLMEDVGKCTNGFLNRALRAVSRLSQPQNPDEYLYRVRQGLVEKAAISKAVGSDESVHVWNRTSIIAADQRLGIQANYQNDPHPGPILDEDLKVALQKTFERWFTPYELPLLLRDALLNEVAKVGYEGKQETGYATGPMNRITDAVSQLLPDLGLSPDNDPRSWAKIFAWRSPVGEEAEEIEKLASASFYDLKWDFILGEIYQSLPKRGYLDPNKLQPRHLLDFAAYLELCQKAKLEVPDPTHNVPDEQTYIQQLFQKQQYGQLGEIFDEYPSYWKHLLGQLDFSAQTGNLTQFLRTALRIPKDREAREEAQWKKEIRCALLVLINTLSAAERYNDATREELTRLFTKPSTRQRTYLSLALRYHPDLLPKLLETIFQNKSCWSAKTLPTMLLGSEPIQFAPIKAALRWMVDRNNLQLLRELLPLLRQCSMDNTAFATELRNLFRSPDDAGNPADTVIAHLINRAAYSEHVEALTLQELLGFVSNSPKLFHDADLNKILHFDYDRLVRALTPSHRSGSEKIDVILRCLHLSTTDCKRGAISRLIPDSAWAPSIPRPPNPFNPETQPSEYMNFETQNYRIAMENIRLQELWISKQWRTLISLVEGNAVLANGLLLDVTRRYPKLELEQSEQAQVIPFVFKRLCLLNRSDSAEEVQIFQESLSNLGGTKRLLQRLLTDDTLQKQAADNLPALLRILLPNHLEALHQKAQLPPSPMRRIRGFFRPGPDGGVEKINQEIAFTHRWIEALNTPNNGDNNSIRPALLALLSNPSDMDFLAKNEDWNDLFKKCYQQIPDVPLPSPHQGP